MNSFYLNTRLLELTILKNRNYWRGLRKIKLELFGEFLRIILSKKSFLGQQIFIFFIFYYFYFALKGLIS